MRAGGIILLLLGLVWIVMCFGGIAMMSRSVDMFMEAFLPSTLGFIVAGLGFWMIQRGRIATRMTKPP